MGELVQIIMGGALLSVIVIAIVIFAKVMFKEGKNLIKSVLVIELLLIICTGVFLLSLKGTAVNIGGFFLITILLTMLANLPIAIIAKFYQVIFLRKDKDKS